MTTINIGPQPGPQTAFLSSLAEIAIYGGAAGGGKSYGLLLEPLYHLENPRFGAVIFRRQAVQIRNEGGLWDESEALYRLCAGDPTAHTLDWAFPSGMHVSFRHLENDAAVYAYQGAQIPLIGFDELTHFTQKQFLYMMSRNRSMSGVPGYIRATTNPDCDSWVRTLIDWWIDDDGYAIPSRSGVLRWFLRRNDNWIWANTKQELLDQYGQDAMPKSLTFIPSKLDDNKILMEKDPSYRANLQALDRVDRLRLEGGNWNVRATSGSMFKREWFPVRDAIPSGWTSVIRFWDRAATKPNEINQDPDFTRGLLLYRYPNGTFMVGDMKSCRDTPGQVERLIVNVAAQDSYGVMIMAQQDPGSAGVAEAANFMRMLQGYNVRTMPLTKDKITRAKPVSAQAEVGNILVLRAPWNNEFFQELESFPEGNHDDQVDVLSGAFNALCTGNSSSLEVYSQLVRR